MSKAKNRKWVYLSNLNETEEYFALAQTWNKQKPGTSINFWHITPAHEWLFTFRPTSKYNKDTMWSDRICRELEEDMKSQNPSVEVIRFAVDGMYIFKEEDHQSDAVPKPPAASKSFEKESTNKTPEQKKEETKRRRRIFIEDKMGKVPAPFILYGKHENSEKEYSWKLTPDKPKRQGIVPGDTVMVWTRNGFTKATVTRIESLEADQPQPAARVKKKLAPGEQVPKY